MRNVSIYSACKFQQIELFTDPLSILRLPRVLRFKPDAKLRRQIAVYLATVYLKPWNFILDEIPEEMEKWGKVRIADGGDCIRTSLTGSNQRGRDQSFVRVSHTSVLFG